MLHAFLGSDPSGRIVGIDEKPLHFNEGGSKHIGTLEIAGAPAVRLKQNHAATRGRVTLMTSVTSDPALASRPERMPLELLCKAKSPRRSRGLVLPPGALVSVTWSEKGSYRQTHVLAYLDRHSEPWTELRARENDWRILMLDVAASHCGPEVVALAHSRGYACLYHYGCTTGVAQVNDTDLHGKFSHLYIGREQAAFNMQQMFDPADISRNLQAVLNDASATWRCCDHQKGVRGHSVGWISYLTPHKSPMIR